MPTPPPFASHAAAGRPEAVFGGRRLVGHLLGRRGKAPTDGGRGNDDLHDTREPARPVALVVDDSPIARMLIASILESFEVDVFEASGSAEAVALVGECRPDVLIIDWTLREETAADVLDALEARCADGLPPVVMVSAAARLPGDLRATATLRKPFTPRELYGALTTVFSGQAGGAAEA